jgi:nudix-type nucleoside diphosphatase (YffH/AdpP family)
VRDARDLATREIDASRKETDVGSHDIVAVTTLYQGWARFLKLAIRRPQGDTMEREVEDHGSATAVLPFDPERRMALLVRQFRAPVFHAGGPPTLLEAVAGLLDEDDPESCARREAYEEVGLRLGPMERIATAWPMPGLSTERIHLFLARYRPSDRVGKGGGLAEEHEDIEAVEIPLRDLWALVDSGGIEDLKTLVLTQALKLRHPEVFA